MTILIIRPEPSANELVLRLRQLGKNAWSLPLIKCIPGRELEYLPDYLSQMYPGDLVFFISKHAVKFSHARLKYSNKMWPQYLNYYSIGRCTALAINSVTNLKVKYPQEKENSETLVKLESLQYVQGKNALILRGSPGFELIAQTMTERGVKVKYCECYQRYYKYYDGTIEGMRWRARGIKTLIVTSCEILEKLFMLFPSIDRHEWLIHCRLLVISKRIATQAAILGWKNIEVAKSANNDALLKLLI